MTVTEFLAYFYPDEAEPICARVVRAKGSSVFPPAKSLEVCRAELKGSKTLQEELRKWNRTHGMYFCVNAGGNSDNEIERINAVFCEIDDKSIQEQLDAYEMSPIAPSLQVITKKSVHAYWLLNEFITPNEFRTLQKGLVKYFDSDESITNPARIMRIPFFNHVAFADGQYSYKPITVHAVRDFRYDFSELYTEFPYEAPPLKKYVRRNFGHRNDANEELIARIQQTPEYHVERGYGYTRGICHDGTRHNGIFVHLATGAVKCFTRVCTWFDICSAFGIEVNKKC